MPSPRPSHRSGVPPFTVMTVLARVAELRAAGRDVISLCAGEPSQGAPADVRRRLAELMTGPIPLGYSETFGIRPLREKLVGHYARWYGLDVDPGRIAITTGSSAAFLHTFLAAFDPGDRVLLARPGYPAYRNILTSLGCTVVELDCGPELRFQPQVGQLDHALTEGPVAGLVIASPANPTGTMIDHDHLRELADWCRDHGVRLVSDEIYHGISYTGSVGSCALAHDPQSVIISSFSKYWGMTGWRLGWAILPDDLVPGFDALAGNIALCPPVPAQHAAIEAFTEASYAEADAAVAGFAEARQVILGAVDELGWSGLAPVDGAFYVYAGIDDQLRGHYRTSAEWAAALLDSHGVAVTPGLDFDGVNGDSWIRLSLAAGPAAVTAAIDRILAFQRASNA